MNQLSYGKAPTRGAVNKQYALEALTGFPYRRRGNRILKSNGIGPDPAYDQSPVVQTVCTTADPAIRSKNPRFVVPGNYVADVSAGGVGVPPVYSTARGDWVFTVKRANPAHNTWFNKAVGRSFQRAEATPTNLDCRLDVSFLGVFLNPGATRGVIGDPNDPLGVVAIGGTHEVCNTGVWTIRVNDYVCVFPSAYANEEPSSDPEYPSHRSVVLIKDTNPLKLHGQPVPFASVDFLTTALSLQHTYRARVADLFGKDGKIFDRAECKPDVINNTLARVIRKVRTDIAITPHGTVPYIVNWVLVDLCLYCYVTILAILGTRIGNAALQTAYELLYEACQIHFSQPVMFDSDRSRWADNLAKSAPLDLSSKAASDSNWNAQMVSSRGAQRGQRGWYLQTVAHKALLECACQGQRMINKFYAGKAMSEANTSYSFTLHIRAAMS